jgi:hypothetical protein
VTHRKGSGRAKYVIADAPNDEMVVKEGFCEAGFLTTGCARHLNFRDRQKFAPHSDGCARGDRAK